MFETYLGLFEQRVAEFGHATAARHRIDDTWEAISWREWWLESERFGAALLEFGIASHERIAVVSETRYEWLVADIGCMMARTPSMAIFPSTSVESLEKILQDAKPKLVVLEDPAQLEKFLACKPLCKTVVLLDHIATFMEPDPHGRTLVNLQDIDLDSWSGRVLMYDEFMSIGRRSLAQSATEIAERRLMVAPDDIAAIVYTSGTTSDHRGVVITHRNIVNQVLALEELKLLKRGEMHLLTLPLAHIFAKVILWASVSTGVETAIGTGLRTIIRDATEIQPHLIATVPSLLDHFRRGVRRDLGRFGSLRQRALDSIWTAGLSLKVVDDLRRRMGAELARNAIEAMFGTRLTTFISGGAKMDPQLAAFFEQVGLNVIEGYGLTETTGVVAVGRPNNTSAGTVGFPLPGMDVALDERSEIWVRGKSVSPGYFKSDGEIEPIKNDEGWFQTGDIGAFDDLGRLQILGRISDEIVTSGGRKVSPRSVELKLEQSPDITRAFVCGDGRPYVVALLVTREGTTETDVESHVQTVNQAIATTQTIRRYECLAEPFSVERGEVTETGKLRRGAIVRTRNALIEHMYR